jgi:hypothetical protein
VEASALQIRKDRAKEEETVQEEFPEFPKFLFNSQVKKHN